MANIVILVDILGREARPNYMFFKSVSKKTFSFIIKIHIKDRKKDESGKY